MDRKSRLFERIERLYDLGLIGRAKVLVAGWVLGQPGCASARDVRHPQFPLSDDQTLGKKIVIRHACGLRYIGWKKTDAVAKPLKDRNPEVHRRSYEDLMAFAGVDDGCAGPVL